MLVEKALLQAIKICGNKQKLLAHAIGENPDKIRYWLNNSGRIPFHNAIAIEHATLGRVSRFDLAPYARITQTKTSAEIPKITISAQVALGIAFENALPKRNGARNDLLSRKNIYTVTGRTDVLAAKQAGFRNHVSYRQAKKAVLQGVFKLVQAMDAGLISISNAAVLADLPPEQQEDILQNNKKQIITIIKNLRKKL